MKNVKVSQHHRHCRRRHPPHLSSPQYPKAVDDAKLAIKYDPGNVKAYFRLATYSLSLSCFDEAIKAAEGGLKVQPTNKALMRLKAKAKQGRKTAVKPASSKMSSSNKAYTPLYPEKTEKNGSARDLLRQLRLVVLK